MSSLLAACLFFLLVHFGVAGTRLRDVLVARLGDNGYRAGFSIFSVAGLVWMGGAYARAPEVMLWNLYPAIRWPAYALVLAAMLFIVLGLATPNPTTAGMERKLSLGADAARGIVRITRHPFLWGVAVWALVHLVANGDVASLALFGSLLLLSVGGTASIDAKRRRACGEAWAPFAGVTSNLPFAAIVGGRNRLPEALREIGLLRPAIAVAVFGVLFALHGRLFGAALVL
jgi:uncharacterized membrane protein